MASNLSMEWGEDEISNGGLMQHILLRTKTKPCSKMSDFVRVSPSLYEKLMLILGFHIILKNDSYNEQKVLLRDKMIFSFELSIKLVIVLSINLIHKAHQFIK